MGDFVPDDMLTIELNPREEIVSNFLLEFSKHVFYSPFTRMHQRSLFTSEELTL